jgi:PAS domain S-box-containing protein
VERLDREFRGHSGRYRIVASVFAVTALMVISSTLLTYWFGNRVLNAHAREESRRELIANVNELVSTVKDAETGERGFIITGDNSYLAPYEEAARRLPRAIAHAKALDRDSDDASDIATVGTLVDNKMAELAKTIEVRKTSGPEAAVAIIRQGEGRKMMDDLRAAVAKVDARQKEKLNQDVKLSDATTRTRTFVFVTMGLLNVGFLLWAYQRIARALRQRDVALSAAHERGRALQTQKDLLSVTLGSIGDCVIVTDEQGQINFMNAVAERVTGWTFAEARGRPTRDVFHILNEQTREPAENPVEKVTKQGVIIGLANHTLLVRRDGTEIPIDDSGAPIRDADGKMCGVVLVFRDFSEHRKAERDLRAAKEEAETASRTKDRFLAMLSHELRTPLTPVLATLNLWEASEDIPTSLQPEIQMLRRSIELEARIIDDLLDLTRISRGMLSFSPENTDVHALLEFLIGLSQSELQEKNLHIALQLKAERHYIHTDSARLQQVFWNILRNAVKFTENGGQITVTTANDLEGKIQIEIADTGIGMSRETISRLFLPFEQADSARSSRYGGLGLGMAISSALVELLNGTLTAKSEGLGRGSSFALSFQTIAVAENRRTDEPARPIENGKASLLLVEDHPDTARALTKLLESRGYRVRAESTVADGLKAVEQEKFDILLCDLGLPDGTGFDFVTKAHTLRRIPAIALTGFGMQQDVERSKVAGFAAHLTKPVNLQKLESTIWAVLHDE